MKEFTEPVKDSAVIGNVIHFFDLVDKKEERMACVQKHKVELYKEINREFLRALSTPDPAAAAASFRKYANVLRTQVTGQEVEALQADLKALAD